MTFFDFIEAEYANQPGRLALAVAFRNLRYNNQRRNSTIGQVSPQTYENSITPALAA